MKNWKEISVKPDSTIREAIEIIDKSAVQIALVADDENRLLGTITDGDVRRGILKGITLDQTVELVYNNKPITVTVGDDYEYIIRLMKRQYIRQLPVIDEDGRIVRLELLKEIYKKKDRNNTVVIMAGGLGTRMKPLTDTCPKPLLKVNEKPILEIIIQNLIEYDFKKIFLTVNYKAEMIKDYFNDGKRWGIDIRYIYEKKKLGTAGALGLIDISEIKDPILVMNGDLLTKINFSHLIQFHQEHKSQATMCVNQFDFRVPYGVVRIDGQNMIGIDEKPTHSFLVNAGIYVLEPKILKYVSKNDYLDMPTLFEKTISDKLKTIVFPIREYWLDIGQPKDFDLARREFYDKSRS